MKRKNRIEPTVKTQMAQMFWRAVLAYQPASPSNPHQYHRNGVPIIRTTVNATKNVSLLTSVQVSQSLGMISLAAKKIEVRSIAVSKSPQPGMPNPAIDEVA